MKFFVHKIPFIILLIAVFFCANGYHFYAPYISFSQAFASFFYIAFIGIISFFILFFISKNYNTSIVVTGFAMLLYLFFGAIQDFLIAHHLRMASYLFLLPILLFCIGFIYFLCRKHDAYLPRLIRFVNIVFLVLSVYELFFGYIKNNLHLRTPSENVQTFSAQDKPNIYFLLFDSYPGFHTAQQDLNLNNSAFYSELNQLRFTTYPNSESNYDFTQFSMASIFNMDYLGFHFDAQNVGLFDYLMCYKQLKNATLFKTLQHNGYNIFNASYFNILEHKSPIKESEFILAGTRLVNDKMLHNRIIRHLKHLLILGKYRQNFAIEKWEKQTWRNNQTVLQLLYQQAKPNKPTFTYAHLLMPHHPYYYDEKGNLLPNHTFTELQLFDTSAIRKYTLFTNKVILQQCKQIIQKDSNAVIVVMSDHSFVIPNIYQRKFNSLLAIRSKQSAGVSLPDTMPAVNVFRHLLNTNFGTNYSILPRKNIDLNDKKL